MRTILGPVLSALAIAAPGLAAAAEEGALSQSYWDLRGSWSQPMGLSIEEDVDGVNYEWLGESKRGNRGQITLLYGFDRNGGFFVGGDASYTNWTVSPDGFLSDGVTYGRSIGDGLNATLALVDLQVGYGLGMPLTDSLSLWCEAAPMAGLGWMRAQTDAADQVNSDAAIAYEYGARIGVYLMERNWLFGATGSWSKVSSDVDVDLGNGASSSLDLKSDGFRLGIEAGYRF